MTSQTIKALEIPQLLERRNNDKNFVLYPIIAKPCSWKAVPWLGQLQVRPYGGAPIWAKGKAIDADAKLTQIADEVTEIVKNLWFSKK